mmetsp:Transcript_32495/g.107453  ORF Transcript_32495/g.107453 Transcript_32495/m.107453 type:complete len:202 (+) Transcript_32495:341-946(+)
MKLRAPTTSERGGDGASWPRWRLMRSMCLWWDGRVCCASKSQLKGKTSMSPVAETPLWSLARAVAARCFAQRQQAAKLSWCSSCSAWVSVCTKWTRIAPRPCMRRQRPIRWKCAPLSRPLAPRRFCPTCEGAARLTSRPRKATWQCAASSRPSPPTRISRPLMRQPPCPHCTSLRAAATGPQLRRPCVRRPLIWTRAAPPV